LQSNFLFYISFLLLDSLFSQICLYISNFSFYQFKDEFSFTSYLSFISRLVAWLFNGMCSHYNGCWIFWMGYTLTFWALSGIFKIRRLSKYDFFTTFFSGKFRIFSFSLLIIILSSQETFSNYTDFDVKSSIWISYFFTTGISPRSVQLE